MKKGKITLFSRAGGKGSNIMFGIIISFLFLIILSLIASLILLKASNPLGAVSKYSFAVLLISGGACGFITSKRGGSFGLAASLISSLIFVFIMLTFALIFKHGTIGGKVFMNALCYVGISALFALLGKKRGNKTRHHRRR